HVETDVLAVVAVAVALERAHLIESDAQVIASKRLVLVELQSVLVVQMQRPEFAEGHRELDFIGGIKPSEDRVRAFDETTHTFRIARQLCDGKRVSYRWQISVVHRLVRLRLDGETDFFVVRQHRVERLNEVLEAAARVFRFANVTAFTREPKHENIRPKD